MQSSVQTTWPSWSDHAKLLSWQCQSFRNWEKEFWATFLTVHFLCLDPKSLKSFDLRIQLHLMDLMVMNLLKRSGAKATDRRTNYPLNSTLESNEFQTIPQPQVILQRSETVFAEHSFHWKRIIAESFIARSPRAWNHKPQLSDLANRSMLCAAHCVNTQLNSSCCRGSKFDHNAGKSPEVSWAVFYHRTVF